MLTEPLGRVTTEYIDREDRLRLSAESSTRLTMVIWLTQRLMQRLVPILLKWLEQRQGLTNARADIMHGWAQQAARAGLSEQHPVKADEARSVWLAQSVDIAQSPDKVVLTFKGPDHERAQWILEADPLRQWLNIVYDAHVVAGWALSVWPEWVTGAALTNQAATKVVH